MARAASSKAVVSITNVEPTMLLMRKYGREFTNLVRTEVTTQVSPYVAEQIAASARASTPQGRAVAGTFRAGRDRLPAVRGLGATKVTTSGASAGVIGFGANWGGGERRRTYTGRTPAGAAYQVTRHVTRQFGAWTGGGSSDRFIYSTIHEHSRQINERWQSALDVVYAAWNRGQTVPGREFLATFKSLGADKLQRDFNGVAASTGKLDKGLKEVNTSGVRTQRRVSELGVSLAGLARVAAGLSIGRFFKDAVTGAATMETNLRGMASVLGDVQTQNIADWAKENGDALNLSQAAAIDASKSFVVYAKAVQDAGGDSAKFTTDMVRMTAELAAFKGADPGEVIDSMAAALRGEFDPLEKFGVALTAIQVQAEAAKLGLTGVGEAMTQSDRAIATSTLIMEQGGFALGSVARNADTLPGQLADIRQQAADLALALGRGLLPAITGLVTGLNDLMKAFNKLPGSVRVFIATFAGLAILKKLLGDSLTPVTQGLKNLRASMAETSGAVSKFSVGMRGIVTAFNPWTLVVTAGVTLLTLWIGKQQAAKQAAEEWAAGIDTATGALNEQGRALLENELADMADEAKAAGVAVGDLSKVVGDTDAYQSLIDQLNAVAEANVTTTRALGPHGGVAKTYNDQGKAALDLARELDGLHDRYTAGLDINRNLKAVQDGVTDSLNAGSQAAEDQAARMKALADRVKSTSDDYAELLDNFTAVNDAMVESRSTVYDYQGALDDLAESLSKGGNTFAPDSEAGRENWDNLVKIADTASARITNTLKRKGSDAADTVYRNSKQTLHTMLVNAGVESGRAWQLVDEVLKKPHTMHVELNQASLAKARKDLARLREKKQTISAEFSISGPIAADAAERAGKELDKRLKPVQVKIDAALGKLKPVKDDLDDVAKPKGKDRKAPVVAVADTTTAEAVLAAFVGKSRVAHIGVVFDGPPGALSLLPGVTVGPTAAPTATALLGPAATAGPWTPTLAQQAAQQGTSGPQVVRLAPKSTPVAVYLDGVEIAHRIEARRGMAATSSVRRSA